jgi:hypothetical protein
MMVPPPAAYTETRAAIKEHSVHVFRGQDVTEETQVTFSRLLPSGSRHQRRRRRSMVMHSRQQMGRVGPNASENGQITWRR